MSKSQLLKLRFWQFIIVNLFLFSGLLFYFYYLFETTSFNYSLLTVGLFFMIRAIFHHQYTQLSLVFPPLRALYEYEISQLGENSYHMQRNKQYLLLIPAIVALVFGVIVPYRSIDFDIRSMMMLASPLPIIITNYSLIRHNKKVDTQDIHAYRSYHAERIMISVVFGLLFYFVFSAVMVFAAISLQ